jgi:CheY-like chemotaxis protein
VRPDVVLLDLEFPGPGADGWEVARRLRAAQALGGVVLITLAGYASVDDRQRCEAVGIDEHLVKPVDPEVLRRLLACGLWPARGSVDEAVVAAAATGDRSLTR